MTNPVQQNWVDMKKTNNFSKLDAHSPKYAKANKLFLGFFEMLYVENPSNGDVDALTYDFF